MQGGLKSKKIKGDFPDYLVVGYQILVIDCNTKRILNCEKNNSSPRNTSIGKC